MPAEWRELFHKLVLFIVSSVKEADWHAFQANNNTLLELQQSFIGRSFLISISVYKTHWMLFDIEHKQRNNVKTFQKRSLQLVAFHKWLIFNLNRTQHQPTFFVFEWMDGSSIAPAPAIDTIQFKNLIAFKGIHKLKNNTQRILCDECDCVCLRFNWFRLFWISKTINYGFYWSALWWNVIKLLWKL